MGAKIKGAGTDVITIEGVEYLHSCKHMVLPDRIEAGTYLIAGALIGDNLTINKMIPEHISSLTEKLKDIGFKMKIGKDYITISKKDDLKPVQIKTLGYPGFPTDLQQPITTLLTQIDGKSKLEETIYENRFQNVKYLSPN